MKKYIAVLAAVVVVSGGYYFIAQGIGGSDSSQLAQVSNSITSTASDAQVQSAISSTMTTANMCNVVYSQALLYAGTSYDNSKMMCGNAFIHRHTSDTDFTLYQSCMTSAVTSLASTSQNALTAYNSCKAAVAYLYTRLSPNSPAQRTVTVSPSTVTAGVTLGVFGISVKNQNATVSSVSFLIGTSSYAASTTPIFSNIRLSVDGLTFGANAVVNGKVSFTNVKISLTADQWKDLVLMADVAPGYISNNVTVSPTLIASNVVGLSTIGKSLDITNASDITASPITFIQTLTGLSVKNATATLGMAVNGPVSGTTAGTVAYSCSYSFTAVNAGTSDLYLFKNPTSMIAQNKNMASSSISAAVASPGALPGDTSSTFDIPAGSTRTFTLYGLLKSPAGGGMSTLGVAKIYYNSSPTSSTTDNAITSGLSPLNLTATF